MKKLVIVIFFLCLSSSLCEAQNTNYFFKVILNTSFVDTEDKDSGFLNYIYSGEYVEKSEIKNISLDTYDEEDKYKRDNIYLLFDNMIYKISYTDFIEEDGWYVVSSARITMIYFPGTVLEKKQRLILASGKIKFDQKIGLILFIKTSFEEDESRKI